MRPISYITGYPRWNRRLTPVKVHPQESNDNRHPVDGALVGADSVWPGPTHIRPYQFGCPVSLPSGVQFQLPSFSSSSSLPSGPPPVLQFESQARSGTGTTSCWAPATTWPRFEIDPQNLLLAYMGFWFNIFF